MCHLSTLPLRHMSDDCLNTSAANIVSGKTPQLFRHGLGLLVVENIPEPRNKFYESIFGTRRTSLGFCEFEIVIEAKDRDGQPSPGHRNEQSGDSVEIEYCSRQSKRHTPHLVEYPILFNKMPDSNDAAAKYSTATDVRGEKSSRVTKVPLAESRRLFVTESSS